MTTYCTYLTADGRTVIHPRQYTCDERCKPVLVIDPEDREQAAELTKAVFLPMFAKKWGADVARKHVTPDEVENVRDALRSLASPQPCPTCGAVAS